MTCLTHNSDMIYSYVLDPFMCVPYSHVWQDPFICATWLFVLETRLLKYDSKNIRYEYMTHSQVWPWLVRLKRITPEPTALNSLREALSVSPCLHHCPVSLIETERPSLSLSVPLIVSFFLSLTCVYVYYGVATISSMLKNIGLFCKRALQKRPIFCRETYLFKHPTNRSHPISDFAKRAQILIHMCDMIHSQQWDTTFSIQDVLESCGTYEWIPTREMDSNKSCSYVPHDSFVNVTYVPHDSNKSCTTFSIHMCHMTTFSIHMCHMTHSYVPHDSFVNVTRSHVWQDPFICAKSPIRIRHATLKAWL